MSEKMILQNYIIELDAVELEIDTMKQTINAINKSLYALEQKVRVLTRRIQSEMEVNYGRGNSQKPHDRNDNNQHGGGKEAECRIK